MKTRSLPLLAAVSLFGGQPILLAHDSGGGSSGNSGGHSGGGGEQHGGAGSSSGGHSGSVGHSGGSNGNWHGSISWHNGGGGSHGGDWHGGHSHGHDGDHGRHFHGGVYFDGPIGYPYGDWDYDYGYGGGSTYYFPPGPSYTQAYQAQAAGSLGAEVQEGLTAAGFYRGPIDGAIGPMTRKAIGRYQSSHHLPVTSRIDEPLLKSLRIL